MAAETAGEHVTEAFWAAPEFWVGIAFVILIALFGRKIYRTIAAGLDARADAIRLRVEEAERLRDEAQEILADYQRKQNEAAKETEEMVQRAQDEAERLTKRSVEDLERSLQRREQLAMERIAHAESAALDEVRTAAVDVALEATRRVLAESLPAKKADALIDDAIKGIPGKLH